MPSQLILPRVIVSELRFYRGYTDSGENSSCDASLDLLRDESPNAATAAPRGHMELKHAPAALARALPTDGEFSLFIVVGEPGGTLPVAKLNPVVIERLGTLVRFARRLSTTLTVVGGMTPLQLRDLADEMNMLSRDLADLWRGVTGHDLLEE